MSVPVEKDAAKLRKRLAGHQLGTNEPRGILAKLLFRGNGPGTNVLSRVWILDGTETSMAESRLNFGVEAAIEQAIRDPSEDERMEVSDAEIKEGECLR